MVRIIYEHQGEWPEEEPLVVHAQFNGEISVSPNEARRANGYLAREAALFLVAGEPVLHPGDSPCWRVPAVLRLRGFGELTDVGSFDIDAYSGQVRPLSDESLKAMRQRANDIASHLTPSSEAAS